MAQRSNYAPYGDRMVAGTFDLPICCRRPSADRLAPPGARPIVEAVRGHRLTVQAAVGIGPVTLAAITDKHYGGDIKALTRRGEGFNAELRDLQERGGVDMVQVAEP
jgi:hypothetical protein